MNQLTTIPVGALGADYVWLSPRVKQWLLANKAKFVCRYIARRTSIGKIITREEIAWLHEHGIAIVLNYEGSHNDHLAGPAGGKSNGAWSREFVRGLGYPAGAPLVVSIDTDVYSGNLALANAYARGFISEIGPYTPAAYADSDLLAALKPLDPLGWLPNARAWSEASDGAIVHVKQGREDKQWGVDPNVCTRPFVAWLPSNDPTPTPEPENDMTILPRPERIYDTRVIGERLDAGEQRIIPIMARRVRVNITAVNPAANGYITVWGAAGRPQTSNLQLNRGQNSDNTAAVVLGDAGELFVHTTAACHLIVDLQEAGD